MRSIFLWIWLVWSVIVCRTLWRGISVLKHHSHRVKGMAREQAPLYSL